MSDKKETTFSIDEIDSLYWFDPYGNEHFDSNDFELQYLYGIAITAFNYYYDTRLKGTLIDVSHSSVELHNAFVRLCNYLHMTRDDINTVERSIF